jgi:hypothetical protein
MTVIDFQDYLKNKKSIINKPFQDNKQYLRSALCSQLETLLKNGGFPSIRVLYHNSVYVFILNIGLWSFFKIKALEFLKIFSWRGAMLTSIKNVDPGATDLKMLRTWPSDKEISKILKS